MNRAFGLAGISAAIALSLAGCGGGAEGPAAPDEMSAGGVTASPASAEKAAPSSGIERQTFIVTFTDEVSSPGTEARQIADAHRGEIRFVYAHLLKGFSVSLPAAAAPGFERAMRTNARVQRVEADQIVTTTVTQSSPPNWGLDRIDQRALPLSRSYTFVNDGSGVHAYIFDTGIRASHTLFGGRVSPGDGYDAILDGRGTDDCNGHGTHVAGTVGASGYGVAQGVTLVPVRVMGCNGSGSWSSVIAGLDWVAANAKKPAVVNLSLGGGAFSTVDDAITRLVAQGITAVVSAGNGNTDACSQSPARAAAAITVGATQSNDARASYSNFGTCLDLFAPGSGIASAWFTSDTSTATLNGTSMAAPHVAGAVARLLQTSPQATPAQIDYSIRTAATTGRVTSAESGSPNRLLFGGDTLIVPPTMHAASITPSSFTVTTSTGSTAWRARATTVVVNQAGQPVSGAVVNGSFSTGGTGRTCTTNTAGTCNITSSNLALSRASVTFTLNSISKTGVVYDPTKNATSPITINRP